MGCGLHGKPLVVSIDEGIFQPGIGGFDVLDAFQGHFGQKTVLEGLEFSFDSSLGLGRVCRDGLNAQFFQDPSQMG